MRHEEVLEELKAFVVREFLEGDAADLDSATPLAELNLINSLSTVVILNFIQTQFGLDAPLDELTVENLGTLEAMTRFVLQLAAAKAG
jgi:acyl carrier protein